MWCKEGKEKEKKKKKKKTKATVYSKTLNNDLHFNLKYIHLRWKSKVAV